MNMRPVVYVLCAEKGSPLLSMLYVSAQFLKFHHPDIKIWLVTDEYTSSNSLVDCKHITNLIDKINVSPNLYKNDLVMMSRHLKTSLVEIVREAFVYIDIDAVVVKPIDELLRLEVDFAACQDGNCDPDSFILPDFEMLPFAEMNWDVPEGPYFNSGVMAVGSSDQAKFLFATWHKLWRTSSKNGHFKDQPPLNIALRECNINYELLDKSYNFLLGMYREAAKSPKIVHYSTVNFKLRNDTIFHGLVKSTMTGSHLNRDTLSRISRQNYFWTDTKSVKNILSARSWTMLPSAIIYKIRQKFRKAEL